MVGSALSGTLADSLGYAWLFGLGTALSTVVLAGSMVLVSDRRP